MGIGTVSPQSPVPNNKESNLDVNDVYLRSTNQWVSGMSGACTLGTQPVLLGTVQVCLKNGAQSDAACEYSYASAWDNIVNTAFKGYAKVSGSMVQTRVTGSDCDSGWVNGYKAQCAHNNIPSKISKAIATAQGVYVEGPYDYCKDLGFWR